MFEASRNSKHQIVGVAGSIGRLALVDLLPGSEQVRCALRHELYALVADADAPAEHLGGRARFATGSAPRTRVLTETPDKRSPVGMNPRSARGLQLAVVLLAAAYGAYSMWAGPHYLSLFHLT
jgi:hypothetical protein